MGRFLGFGVVVMEWVFRFVFFEKVRGKMIGG